MDWHLWKSLIVPKELDFLFTDPADSELFLLVFFVVLLKRMLDTKPDLGHP